MTLDNKISKAFILSLLLASLVNGNKTEAGTDIKHAGKALERSAETKSALLLVLAALGEID